MPWSRASRRAFPGTGLRARARLTLTTHASASPGRSRPRAERRSSGAWISVSFPAISCGRSRASSIRCPRPIEHQRPTGAKTMTNDRPHLFLRHVLVLDAAASGAMSLLLVAGAGVLEGLLGLPVALMREAGLILIPYAALVAWVGTREPIARRAVWAIIAANALWAVASPSLLASGLVAP